MNNIDADIEIVRKAFVSGPEEPPPEAREAFVRLIGGLIKDIRRIADALQPSRS